MRSSTMKLIYNRRPSGEVVEPIDLAQIGAPGSNPCDGRLRGNTYHLFTSNTMKHLSSVSYFSLISYVDNQWRISYNTNNDDPISYSQRG